MPTWLSWLIAAIRVALLPIVLACIGVSAYFAYEFGSSKGTTAVAALAFGVAGAGLDLLKSALPMLASTAADHDDRSVARGCWFGFAVLTMMSLWCAFGITALHLSEKVGVRLQIASEQAQKTAALDRLKRDRATVPAFGFANDQSVEAAQDAVDAADRAVDQECGRVGQNCRLRQGEATERRAELAKAIRDREATKRVEALDAKIALAESNLAHVDVRTLSKDADPQAKMLSEVFGISEMVGTLLGHAVFAIGIEVGSGLGLWLIVGHGRTQQQAPQRHDDGGEEEGQATDPPPAVPVQPANAEPSFGSRAMFFQTCVLPADDQRVPSSIVYRAYQAWCHEIGIKPVSQNVFGRDPPWPKDKIGGTVYYMNCQMAAGYDVLSPLRVVG